MAVDAVAGLALHLHQDCLDTGVFDFGLAAAHRAHDVVVMHRLARHICVLAIGQVEPFEEPQLGEQVERPEDGRSTDVQAPDPGVIVLDERLHPEEIAGTALVLTGLVLASTSRRSRILFARRPPAAG